MNESLVVSSIAASQSRPRVGHYRISPMRRVSLRDRLAFGFASLGLLTLTVLMDHAAVATAADAPRPAQKDSSARAKPKDVALTAVVEPAEAKPGETVSLKVTAKLKPGWHIY